jgi:hypothetical protein
MCPYCSQFARDLDHLHQLVVGEIGQRKRKRLHIHIFENAKDTKSTPLAGSRQTTPSYMSGATGKSEANGTSPSESTDEGKGEKQRKKHPHLRRTHIPMNEALAILEGRTPVLPKKESLIQRIVKLEQIVRSDASLIALKTAAAVSATHRQLINSEIG